MRDRDCMSSNEEQLMVPLTTLKPEEQWGYHRDNGNTCVDLSNGKGEARSQNDLGYEELDQSTIHTTTSSGQLNCSDNNIVVEDTTEVHDDDADSEDEDTQDLPLWRRVPPAFAMAMGLFVISLLTCLGSVYQYKAMLHGHLYAFFFTLAKFTIMVLSAFVIGKTCWYTQQDLDSSIELQDRMHALLASVYPEHVLQRLLEDLEHDEENQNQGQDQGVDNHEGHHLDEQLADAANIDNSQWVNRLGRQHSASNLEGLNKSTDPACRQEQRPETCAPASRQDPVSSMASLVGISNLGLNVDARLEPKKGPKRSKMGCMDDSKNENLKEPLLADPLGASSRRNHHHDGHHAVTKSVTDLYPNTTVFYSQIVGFTAWSSQRAPDQVFELLETVFCEFDEVANRGAIFKVESIADSYIAVTGIPEADLDHAVRMAQFASDCLATFLAITERLERSLGPDTGELQLQIGLHSGPVTAGVLKGERSRFQLFGNTVNNAVLIEKQGQGNHIHLSRETAELIEEAGKEHWVVPREKSAAGMTYWLAAAKGKDRRPSCSHSTTPPMSPTSNSDSSVSSSSEQVVDLESDDETNASGDNLSDDEMSVMTSDTGFTFSSSVSQSSGQSSYGSTGKKAWTMQDILTAKEQRLIEWTVDQLALMLKKIVARRNAIHRYEERHGIVAEASNSATPPILYYTPTSGMVLDEVQEMVMIPRYNDALLREDALHNSSKVDLGDLVVEELTNYVSTVTTFYYDPSRNPFHNFMHASHVLMSVVKMMQRIVSPSQASLQQDKEGKKKGRGRGSKASPRRSLSMEELHDHTYGITTDPLTQFAVVFAALIHDLDHPGVPNATLAQEKTRLARVYNNRSISEQNSLDMAWDLLMDPSYQNLVRTICSSQDELKRFRQLLVQTVMATDIADAELRTARNQRWDKAFADKDPMTDASARNAEEQTELDTDRNRKATIVLEHLMQASDIAHTMQHWEVFKKWNEKLFRETYLAYLHGRSDKDPGDFWYNGEIGFFKFYIIPLAKKLSECGVFGVSSDEYLNYAQNNLQIWESQGEEVVEQFREAVRREYGTKEDSTGISS